MNDIYQDDLAMELYYKLGPEIFSKQEHIDDENEPSEKEINWER